MRRTYDDWKTTDPRDMEPPEKPERDPDADRDDWIDKRLNRGQLTEVADILRDIEEYFDNRADINDAGGPNEAMRLLTEVRAAIRKLEGR